MTVTINLAAAGEPRFIAREVYHSDDLLRVAELLGVIQSGVDSHFIDEFLSDDDNRAALFGLLEVALKRVKGAMV